MGHFAQRLNPLRQLAEMLIELQMQPIERRPGNAGKTRRAQLSRSIREQSKLGVFARGGK